MDSKGFILLNFIADFKRLKTMTTDLELIKFVCQQSSNIEHRLGPDGQDRLRVRVGWEKWTLPMAERDQSAQNDGPEVLHTPPAPQVQIYQPREQMRQASLPVSNTSGAPMSAPPVPYHSLNGFASSYGNFGQAQSTITTTSRRRLQVLRMKLLPWSNHLEAPSRHRLQLHKLA